MRFFNTAGPVNSAIHYCLPPLERLDLPDVLLLIAQQKYFVLHAPRQTGKTTCLLALVTISTPPANTAAFTPMSRLANRPARTFAAAFARL